MRLLVTGAESPLGRVVVEALEGEHELRGTGDADLRSPEQLRPLLEGVETVLHLAPHSPASPATPEAEAEVLDLAARGTYVLLKEALAAGVRRVVLASRLEVLTRYEEAYLLDESWKPRPAPEAAALAPHLAELAVREFVRAEPLLAVCLRLGDLDGADPATSPALAVEAIRKALALDPGGSHYRWWLYHVTESPRFSPARAAEAPLGLRGGGA
ncbi:MAG: NAD-dependent epimerase/dehydratase family protein [Armatimonadota bacterium]